MGKALLLFLLLSSPVDPVRCALVQPSLNFSLLFFFFFFFISLSQFSLMRSYLASRAIS